MPSNTQTGPVNLQQGNTADFVVEYFTAQGLLSIPLGGSVDVSYVNTSNVSTTDTVSLTQNESFFTGSWSSASARLGLATWVVTATGSSAVAVTGQLRIIDRQG